MLGTGGNAAEAAPLAKFSRDASACSAGDYCSAFVESLDADGKSSGSGGGTTSRWLCREGGGTASRWLRCSA